MSDVAGDNFIVKAEVNPVKPVTTTRGVSTGIMTVWNRVDVEYVRMERAVELPVDQIAPCFRHAFAEIDISKKTIATGFDDMGFMGKDEDQSDINMKGYGTAATGVFTMEGHAGWVLLVAASRLWPEKHSMIIYEGEATAQDTFFTVPKSQVILADAPKMALVYDSTRLVGVVPPYPIDRSILTGFTTSFLGTEGELYKFAVEPHNFYDVENFDTPFLEARLKSYGFKNNEKIKVKICGAGEEFTYPYGLSLNTRESGHHASTGRTFVFTRTAPPSDHLRIIVHELTHAFECQHMCGNWNWTNDAAGNACTMNYPSRFILDEAKPRKPLRWTQNQVSPELCPQHLKHLREYHLDENTGLKWTTP